MIQLKYKNFQDVHNALKNKSTTAVELCKYYYQNIAQSKHNAYISLCEERAMEQASKIDQLIAQKGELAFKEFPLLGLPLGIKDNMVIENVRTTAASKMLDQYKAPYTATVVERLEAAGAITLGKLNLDEFAMGGSNENSAYGPVIHPTHEGYIPGGSSGGSATAVRAGLCIGALGSDTGGSVRLPASYCGIVGLKPSYGMVSRYGLIAFSSSLDQIGPMTNTVEDAAKLMEVMGGHDSRDSTSAPRTTQNFVTESISEPDWKNLRIGVPKEYWLDGIEKEVESSVKASIDFFKSKGAQIVDISLPNTQYSVSVYYILAVSEASSNLARFDGVRFGTRPAEANQVTDIADFFKKVRSNFGPEVKRRIILGTFALSSGYYDAYFNRACQVRRMIADDFKNAFTQCDLIAAPVSATTAFKLGEKAADPIKMYLNDILTIPCNLAGIPGLSIPCGQDAKGLPIGMQLIAPAFQDSKLLSVANSFEKNFSHKGGK